MASTQALGPVTTAILAVLRNSVTLTGYVSTRVYPDTSGCGIPSKPDYPYLSVESSGETPENTMGGTADILKWGSHVTVNLRIASSTRSDTQAWTIFGIAKGLLDGQPLTVGGYATSDVAFEGLHQTPAQLVAGQLIREWIAVFDVLVHQ